MSKAFMSKEPAYGLKASGMGANFDGKSVPSPKSKTKTKSSSQPFSQSSGLGQLANKAKMVGSAKTPKNNSTGIDPKGAKGGY